MKIMVYTVITGDYDELKEVQKEKNVDFYCWTNNPNIKSSSWKIFSLENPELLDFVRLGRKTKILGNEELEKNYDIVVYMDANIKLRKPIIEYIKNECDLEKYDFISLKHPERNCIYEEAIACKELKKDYNDIIDKTVDFLKKEKFPKQIGLTASNFIVRKPNNKKTKRMLEEWWNIVKNYSRRDQLSFMYAIWKCSYDKLQIVDIMWNNNKYFYTTEHKKTKEILIIELNAEIARLARINEDLSTEITRLTKLNEELNGENLHLNNKIKEILNSKSWRFATKIQNILSKFRSNKNK